jgi:mRNA interferase MazF
MSPRRGDVHWVEFPIRDPHGAEIEKARPCVVVSLTGVNEIRRTVIVVPLTHGSREAPPIVIAIGSQGADSKAVCDQLVAVDKRRIGKKVGVLTPSELTKLEESMRKVLGL